MPRCFLSLALLAIPVAAAAQPRLEPDRYRTLVEETSGGLFITAGRELASYRADSVEAVVGEFIASNPGALRLKAAAFLHSEAALSAGSVGHLDFARALLSALPEPDREEWLRRWRLAVGYSYHLALNSAAAIAHFEKAVEAAPDDPEMRFALARVAQMAGRQREEQPVSRRAVELLTQLAREDPDTVEYAVRLAGALFDTGQREAATTLLDRLEGMRMPPYPRLAYLLIRGEVALDAGDYAAAETAFAEAAARARRSPGAISGLVAARLAQGKNAEAFEAASGLLSRPPAGWEPEWQFWLGPAIDIQELFGAMRTEIMEGFAQ